MGQCPRQCDKTIKRRSYQSCGSRGRRAELKRIAVEQRFSGEIGVVTPFRAQANLIEELITADNGLAPVLGVSQLISETCTQVSGR